VAKQVTNLVIPHDTIVRQHRNTINPEFKGNYKLENGVTYVDKQNPNTPKEITVRKIDYLK